MKATARLFLATALAFLMAAAFGVQSASATLAAGSYWSRTYDTVYTGGKSASFRFAYYNRTVTGGAMQQLTAFQVLNNSTMGKIHSVQVKAYHFEGGVLNRRVTDRDVTWTGVGTWNTTKYVTVAEMADDVKPSVDMKVIFANGAVMSWNGYRLGL